MASYSITLTTGPYPVTLDGLSKASNAKDRVRAMIPDELTQEQHGNAILQETKIANALLYPHTQDSPPWVGELVDKLEENFRLIREDIRIIRVDANAIRGDVNAIRVDIGLANTRLVRLERWHVQSRNRKSCRAPPAKDLLEVPNVSGQMPSESIPPLQALTSVGQLTRLDARELRRYLAFYSITYSTSDPSLNKTRLYQELGIPLE